MLIHIQDDVLRLQGMGVLEPLLADRTTGRNILWATDAYAELGRQYARNEEITAVKITGDCAGIIRTRARKAFEQQSQRTKQRAEVFTPLWIVEKMNDHLDEVWFQRKTGFHKLDEAGRISFNTNKTWQQYVENRRLEITCGEAPFLTTRYDAVSGKVLPLEKRVGLLDRKLRAVSENTDAPGDWFTWAFRALRATYGYEFQGDSLLIARINVIMAFWEAMEARWGQPPTAAQLRKAAEIVAWNLWQMDGLTDRVPYAKVNLQLSLFDLLPDAKPPLPPYCRIKNWRQQSTNQFRSLKGERTRMKFDFVIGNPPYNEEAPGGSTSDKPIYHLFMDEAFTVANCVELITPARFLFNAGGTPKQWNKKMLESEHLKVLFYEQEAKKVFANTVFTGGVAITIFNGEKACAPIGVFIPYAELNSLRNKVVSNRSFSSLSSIVSGRTPYLFTGVFHTEHPEAEEQLSKGHLYDISSNAFSSLPDIFLQETPDNPKMYYRVLGRFSNQRTYRWLLKKYARGRSNDYTTKWKVFLPKANGASGMLGDTPARLISKPEVGSPEEIATDTFFCVGAYDNSTEAVNLKKYILSKFARALLGSLKVTQINAKETWRNVPLQDFTSTSDIDWSKSLPEIDRQLYKKYDLDDAEIAFIENHVEEMA